MEELNSYLGMAKSDYSFAKSSLDVGEMVGNYNQVVAILAQAGEKYLKAVIELCFIGDDDAMVLLHSHNLRALYNKVITKFELKVSSKDCKWLGDFYFDARYPGDNFVVANRKDADECLKIVKQLEIDITKIIFAERKKRQERAEALKAFSAFDT